MQKIIILFSFICMSTSFVSYSSSNTAESEDGFFAGVDCSWLAMQVYDELVNQEISIEMARLHSFETLQECEQDN